jgi:hypothetical protein
MIIPKHIMKQYREAGFTEEEARETEKKIYDVFPESKKERTCAAEKAALDDCRKERREKLISKRQYDKTGLHGSVCKDQPETGDQVVS